MSKFFTSHIPMRFYSRLRRLYYIPGDIAETVFKKKDELNPPRSKSFIYGFDFEKVGEEYARHLVELGGLKRNDRILDIGCGIGRVAIPLTKHLTGEGEYRGFDIIQEGIDWCMKNITPKFPNFHFQAVNIYNKSYHPKGKYNAAEFKFPYDDEYFDFACATSVFTHMLPPDTENYLAEVSRILKPGGRCFHTFFLLNEEAMTFMSEGASRFNFQYDGNGYRTVSRNDPEKAIAYDESRIRQLYQERGLRIDEPVHFGSWCGRKRYLSGQDIITAVKKS